MNVLIVHAHHEPQSFNAAMQQLAVEELRAQGHSVEVSDLHAMHWNPVASAADFAARKEPDYLVYALEQRHNQQHQSLAADIQGELDKLLRADLVIFNFPVYWFSMPAIMKGWIDRVLVSGVCYGGKRFYDQGGLAGKRAMLAISIGGRPHMLVEGGVHGELNDMLRPILRGTLAYTGMTVLPPFVAHHVPYITHEARNTASACATWTACSRCSSSASSSSTSTCTLCLRETSVMRKGRIIDPLAAAEAGCGPKLRLSLSRLV